MFWAMYPPFICIIEGDSTIFAEDDEILIRQLALSAKDESMRGHTIIALLISKLVDIPAGPKSS